MGPPKGSLAPSTIWGHSRKTAICVPGSGSHQPLKSARALILDLQPPEQGEVIVYC